MTIFWICLCSLIALYLVFVAFPGILSAFLIFMPQKSLSESEDGMKKSYYAPYLPEIKRCVAEMKALPRVDLKIGGYDRTALHCEYYPNADSDKVVLFFHGYRADPYVNFAVQSDFFRCAGYNIAFVRQRAHNGAEGKHIGLGTVERHDVLSWCEYFRDHTENRAAVLYGISMGSASVGYASDTLPRDFVRALILDCGFCSAEEQIRRDCEKRNVPNRVIMPYIRLMARILLKEDITDSVCNHLAHCKIPCFFLHGKADRTVSIHDSEEAFRACAAEKEWVPVESAEHTVALACGGEAVKEKLTDFLRQNI